jgi:hypothetical protein
MTMNRDDRTMLYFLLGGGAIFTVLAGLQGEFFPFGNVAVKMLTGATFGVAGVLVGLLVAVRLRTRHERYRKG